MIQKTKNNFKFLQAIKARQSALGRKGLRRKPPRWLPPDAIEREYENFMIEQVNDLEDKIQGILISNLASLKRQADVALRGDDFIDDIKNAMTALSVFTVNMNKTVEEVAGNIGLQVSTFNNRQHKKIINATLGVDPLSGNQGIEKRIKAFAAQNASLIQGLNAETLKKVEGIAQRGLLGGATVRDLELDILDAMETTRSRARLIARDQIGKLNAQLTEKRQTDLGIELYIYNDVNDERVRPNHAIMDGKICRWDDPTVYKDSLSDKKWKSRSSIGGVQEHPGTDYQCRCFAEPIIDFDDE